MSKNKQISILFNFLCLVWANIFKEKIKFSTIDRGICPPAGELHYLEVDALKLWKI